MSAGQLLLMTPVALEHMISVKKQLLRSLRDREYRRTFVSERVRNSVALQIRALRKQRGDMTQAHLGEALGMAQTWVSRLENPEYGKMTVATLLRLADVFDVDLEIKFRPFSMTINTLSTQGPDYFAVPSFEDEYGRQAIAKSRAIGGVSIQTAPSAQLQLPRFIPTNGKPAVGETFRTPSAKLDYGTLPHEDLLAPVWQAPNSQPYQITRVVGA